MSAIFFVVPGAPVGKGRPKFARRGNFVATYTPEKTANYENLVKVTAHSAMRGTPLIEGPVRLDLKLFVTPPASWSKKKTALALGGAVLPTTKPDIDNVLKGICDAMNGVVFMDDKQVCEVSVTKRYAATPEVAVHVSEMSFIESAA
jgi:Holliday junction resolvase RusA-like endonuclease